MFPRKENRPAKRDRIPDPPKSRPRRTGRGCGRVPGDAVQVEGGTRPPRGGKAPFRCRASALTLLFLPLISLLVFSFQMSSSPALAAGEETPTFHWPAKGQVIRGFKAPTGHYGEGGHAGIDIALGPGSEVRASAPGVVTFSGRTPLGLCVSIGHAGDVKTTYVSLRGSKVRRGQRVEAGQIIGESDGSLDPSSSLPHLHFGLFVGGVAVDPLPFLRGALLDPRSLFLGPWEDTRSAQAYMDRHGGGSGFLEWLERGVDTLGGWAVEGARKAGDVLARTISTAWDWICRGAQALGRAAVGVYRTCLEPWVSPFVDAAGRALKAILSNRFVQAFLAGLAAAVLICLAATGIGAALGFSLAAVVTACLAGSAASLGYAFYRAFAYGDSFSFLSCFLGSLAVGGAAAGGCMLLSYLAPAAAAGWANLGWVGFGKGFMAHGMANLLVYTGFSLASGKGVSLGGALVSFLVGGLMGGMGRLLVSGIFSGGAAQAAAGFLSSGGQLLGGGAVTQTMAYASAWFSGFSQKLAYMLFCGCAGVLGDLALRVATGGRPSLLESLLSFGGGFLAGGISLLGQGQGLGKMLSSLSGGRLRVSSEFTRALAGKTISQGLKEGAKAAWRRLSGGKRAEESLRPLEGDTACVARSPTW
ncbi:MAG: M23 family metallopeptidase [Actinomycetota bacterium]